MLVFNLFGKKDTECIRFERYFLSMGNCLEDFWSIMRKDMNGFSREEEEAFIGDGPKVLGFPGVSQGSLMVSPPPDVS